MTGEPTSASTGEEPRGRFGRLIQHVRTNPRGAWLIALLVPALAVCPTTVAATPPQPAGEPPLSLERIREGLERPPPRHLTPAVPEPLRVTFKARVDQRVFVPTLEEHLHKVFDLNLLQRQSADWASRCCGFNVGELVTHLENALRNRKIRKTREQIARELAELERANGASPARDVK